MLKLTALEGNIQKYDGGAMYGHLPKVLWEKNSPVDQLNRITIITRSLLVQTDNNKNILFEAGVSDHLSPSLRDRFGITQNENILLKNLKTAGLTPEDIDAVIISHLHFDHTGGLLTPFEEGADKLLFPKAKIYISAGHWQRTKELHHREKASFIPELHQLLTDSGQLVLVDSQRAPELGDWLRFRFSDGHTTGMLISEIITEPSPIIFTSDLMAGSWWVHLPISSSYDRFPELLIDEKKQILEEMINSSKRVFFVHDPEIACALIKKDKKGRYYAKETDL